MRFTDNANLGIVYYIKLFGKPNKVFELRHYVNFLRIIHDLIT